MPHGLKNLPSSDTVIPIEGQQAKKHKLEEVPWKLETKLLSSIETPEDLAICVAEGISEESFVVSEPDHAAVFTYIVEHAREHDGMLPTLDDLRLLHQFEAVDPGDTRSYAVEVHRRELARKARSAILQIIDPLETDPTAAIEELAAELAKLSQTSNDATKFHFWTGDEIAAAVSVEIDWVAKPYLVRGSATELSGHIKWGKSTLTAHLCRAILDGTPFLGEPTAKGPVVYITEQPPMSFRQLMAAAGLDRDDFHVLYWLDTLGTPWPKVAEAAVARALEVGAVLLVADTLSQLANFKGEEENMAGAAQEAMKPLQEAAAKGLAVLALRQDRKSGGEVGDSGRGSGAFGGGFDILVALKRPQGQPRETIRVLDAISRFGNVPASQAIELTPDGYISLGSTAAVAEAEAEKVILEALPWEEDAALPFSSKDGQQRTIRALLPENISEATARRTLQKLAEAGTISKKGRGVAKDPQRYWREAEEGAL